MSFNSDGVQHTSLTDTLSKMDGYECTVAVGLPFFSRKCTRRRTTSISDNRWLSLLLLCIRCTCTLLSDDAAKFLRSDIDALVSIILSVIVPLVSSSCSFVVVVGKNERKIASSSFLESE
jgi:hypothetical protein